MSDITFHEELAIIGFEMTDTSRRCDSCGAQAYWTTHISGTDLSWCIHHFREYEIKLRSVASKVSDHTDELEQELAPA